MLLLLATFYFFEALLVATESIQGVTEEKRALLAEKRIKPNQGALSFIASINNNPLSVNKTFYDKDINPLRVPDKFYEQRKKKNKVTKSPKRTIQKIIKNGKNRSRKIYVRPVTRRPTLATEDVEIPYSSTERNIERRDKPTEHVHRRKHKKNLRVARYPMPFQKFQTKLNVYKRNRRETARNDVFIIKDLDEIEFLSKDQDYDVVRTHVKNYW